MLDLEASRVYGIAVWIRRLTMNTVAASTVGSVVREHGERDGKSGVRKHYAQETYSSTVCHPQSESIPSGRVVT